MTATSTPTAPAQQRFGKLDLSVPRGAAELTSIGLGALLFLVIGLALEWKISLALLAMVGFAATTWAARSMGRALICSLGAMGLIAALMAIVGRLGAGAVQTLDVGWTFLFVLWWSVAFLLAVLFRAAGVRPEFDLPLTLGCVLSIGIAATIAVKLNFNANLLFYVIANEDNAAWVSIATQNAFGGSIASQFTSALGPVMPLLLGLLGGAQRSDIPATNSVMAAYALAVIVCPLLGASLLRGPGVRDWPRSVAIAFTLIVFAWLFYVPALLYRDFGHLSAIWTIYGLLGFVSLAAFDKLRPMLVPASIGLLLFIGGSWFPAAPLAGILALGFVIGSMSGSGRRLRIGVVAAFGVASVVLLMQLRASGIAIGTDLRELRGSLEGLYQSPGGVAQADPVLRALVVGGVVALSFLGPKLGTAGRKLFLILVTLLGYSAVVYAGSALLNSGDQSYGALKVAFVALFSSAVVLVAVVPRFRLSTDQYLATAIALSFGALTLGGGTLLLQRSWPGDGTFPSWLGAVEAIVENQKEPRPVACFASNDGQAAYACMRWAGALLTIGDGAYLRYRLRAVKGTVSQEDIIDLRKSGVLAGSDVLFLDRPTEKAWWGRILLREGGRVFGPTGKPLKRRAVSAIELLPPPAPAQ